MFRSLLRLIPGTRRPRRVYLEEGRFTLVSRDACGELHRRTYADDEPLMLVRVVNGTPEPDGSRRRYTLRVPPHMRSARQAVAWTFGLTAEEYRPDVES